jgi:RimJ/RimL family protein N-acetyltransferase
MPVFAAAHGALPRPREIATITQSDPEGALIADPVAGASPAAAVPGRIAWSPAPRRRPDRVPHRGRWTTLEPLAAAHVADLLPHALGAPESWAWLPPGRFDDAASFAAYVRMAVASRNELLWAVRPHDAHGGVGPAAGWLGLLHIEPRHASLELGNVWFPPGLARTRAATEAVALLLRHVFDRLGYRRVVWKCDVAHAASRAAAERFGFCYEGTARAHMIVGGRRRDTAYHAMLWDQWPDRRAALAAWLAPANFDAAGRARASLRRAP